MKRIRLVQLLYLGAGLLVGSLAIAVNTVGTQFPIHPDEGVFLTIASRLAEGEMPYRDYFDHKPPGIYYVFSLGVQWWGNQIEWMRWMMAGVNGLTAAILGVILARQTTTKIGILGAILYLLIIPFYQGQYGLTEPWVNLSLMAGLFILNLNKRAIVYLLGTGFCLGIALLFKQSAAVLLPMWMWWIGRDRHWYALGWFMLGMISPWVGFIAYWGDLGIWGEVIQQVVWFNLLKYGWRLGESVFASGELVLPLMGVWIGVFGVVRDIRKKSFSDWNLFLTVNLLVSLPILLIRPYHHYWLQLVPWVVLLLAEELDRLDWRGMGLWGNVIIVNVILIVYGLQIAQPALQQQLRISEQIENCQIEAAYEYFLTGCKPGKYFGGGD